MYKRIMAFVDGGADDTAVVREAMKRAKETQAEVALAHFVNTINLNIDTPHALQKYHVEVLQRGIRVLEKARIASEHAKPQLILIGVDQLFRSRVQSLMEEAQRWDVDLIVIRRHEKRRLFRRLFRSTGEKLQQVAKIPVMLVDGHLDRLE
jgi:nucleotide-binding universal stress UspA family protein